VSNPWLHEFWRIVIVLLFVFIIGVVVGYPSETLLLGITLYIAWHLRNIYTLERWLRARKSVEPPDATGIWGEIFNHIHRLQQHNRSRKRKLALMVARFQEAATATPDATIIVKNNWEIEWINLAAKRLLGLRTPHDINHPITNIIRNPLFYTYLQAADYTDPLEITSPANDNTMLSLRIVPYGKNRQLLLVRDITPLHQLEEVRRNFVANASHELVTPLTVFTGYLEMLLDADDDCTKTWTKPLAEMQHQTQRMQGIVEDLLLLSRLETPIQPNTQTTIIIPDLLSQLKQEAHILSGENAHIIDLDIDSSLFLYGNESEIKSAFSNLISNAIRYTPPGQHIGIKWYQNKKGAHLAVQDTGVGIASHHIPRLTERFYRVDTARSRETGGTGLGLAIIKHALSRHNAKLDITSIVGKGSTFVCSFPQTCIRSALSKLT